MNDFLGLFWSIRGLTRSVILFFVGIYLITGEAVLTDGKISLFDIVSITQFQLGVALSAIASIDLGLSIIRFFGNDFSSDFAGVYRASFGYDLDGLIEAIDALAHPLKWADGKNLICPTGTTADAWEKINHEEMAEVDRRIDPESELYGPFGELKTDLAFHISGVKANPAKQVYAFSGFGVVTDEQLSRKGNHNSYINLLMIDPRYSENKLILNGPIELLRFILLGRRLVIRIDQRVTAHNDTEHPVIPIYLHIKLKYRPWIGLYVDGPGIIYLNLIDKERYVVNTYTVDGALR